jgi:F0F1-type ATP synthase membrane subunit b/b'
LWKNQKIKPLKKKNRIVGSAQSEIEKEVVNAKKTLEKDFAASVMSAVKKIVAKEVSISNYQDTVDKSLDDFRK